MQNTMDREAREIADALVQPLIQEAQDALAERLLTLVEATGCEFDAPDGLLTFKGR
jgi:hypothetical protein